MSECETFHFNTVCGSRCISVTPGFLPIRRCTLLAEENSPDFLRAVESLLSHPAAPHRFGTGSVSLFAPVGGRVGGQSYPYIYMRIHTDFFTFRGAVKYNLAEYS
jgi:hypothetical protein